MNHGNPHSVFSSTRSQRAALPELSAAYVPPLIVERIARGGGAADAPSADVFQGVVLFTDIAGFTSLTERLDGRGPDGVEELSRHLNGYFTDLIELIAAHGGLVMKFAGDALIALWPCRGCSLAETAHHAAQCALEIQSRMGQYRVAEDLILSMKVSLGAGEVWHLVLGGIGERWLSILGGAAMDEAREAMQRALAGDVVVRQTLAEMCGQDVVAEGFAGGFRRLLSVSAVETLPAATWSIPDAAHAALLPHVSTAARDRLSAGQAGWLAEFRRVTVLFINIPEITLEPVQLRYTQAAVETIQRLLLRFEGTVDNLAEDYAGLTFVAAFGLPTATHEDDAARGVRLALAVRRELRDMGWSPFIGVATGRMFCGSIGCERRRSYSMVGDGMNRCARLMRMAEHDVLCDESTHRACERVVNFEFLRSVTVRGKTNEVSVFRPADESGLSARTSQVEGISRPMVVGRERERRWLSSRLTALKEHGRAGVMIIEGEAGIGKSTLVAESKAIGQELGLRMLAGAGDSVEQTTSYRVWRRVFCDALELGSLDTNDAEDHLVTFLRGESELLTLLPLLNPVLGLHFSENGITSQMTGRPRAEATARLLSELLIRVAAGEPLVIVLEDCHWLDSASWALALALHRQVPGLLLLLVTRPLGVPAPDEWRYFEEASESDRIVLGPLAGDDVLTLVCKRLEADRLPPDVADLILEKAEGHPFFSEELALALRDSGRLLIENRVCRIAPGTGDLRQLNFPANVQGAVSERLDRLAPREQFAIKVASVHGRTFSLEQLRAVHPVEHDREYLPECLQHLADRELIFPLDREGSDSSFIFKHAIIQDVAYQQLIFSQRRELHQRVAEWLEENDSVNLPLLAHHWTLADVHAKAIHYLNRAGNEALGRFANREAITFVEQAMRMSAAAKQDPGILLRGRWQRQLGTAYFHLGQMDGCKRHLGEAVAIFGHPLPPARKLLWSGLPRAIARQALHRLRGGKCGNWSRIPAEHLLETVVAYILLGEAGYYSNDLLQSIFCIIYALNLAEVLGPSCRLAELYAAAMVVTAGVPPRSIARKYLRLAEEMAGRFDEPLTTAYVRRLVGGYYAGVGEWRSAHEVLALAVVDFTRFGDGRRSEECLTNVIYSHLHRGDFAEGAEALVQMERSALLRQDDQTLGWTRAMGAVLILATVGPAEALEAVGNSATQGSDRLTIIAGLAVTAAVSFRQQDFARARENAEKALQLITESPPVSYTMLSFTSQTAEVLLGLLERAHRAREETRELDRLARRACAAMSQFAMAFPIGRPRALLWKGVRLFIVGRSRAAEDSWQRALAEAEALEMASDQALIHLHLAKICGREHIDKAAAIYRRIRAFAELAKIETSV